MSYSDSEPTVMYQGILFPDRAESLGQENLRGYKVFLSHWDPLAAELRRFYEGLAVRRETRCLIIYGPQGGGKTLFARKLIDDFDVAKKTAQAGSTPPDKDNLWHRMTGGGGLSADLIRTATINTEIYHIEDDKRWVEHAKDWAKARKDRHCLIVADNAERTYFRQGLLNLEDVDFLRHGESQEAITLAGQRFVALCRGELRGCLFVVLTNNDLFALGFDEAVQAQHKGLTKVMQLPQPGAQEKETVVRVNTNRLNRVGYWYCLDKAGPSEKQAVRAALQGASTFPDSFAAVDTAIRTAPSSRMGRPARKCVLSLVVLTSSAPADYSCVDNIGEVERTEVDASFVNIRVFKSGWAQSVLEDLRAARLLESEWQLRVVILGHPFVASLLLGGDDEQRMCASVLESLKKFQGPGTLATTRRAFADDLTMIASSWPDKSGVDLGSFWSKGQTRSNDYEPKLSGILMGYNTQKDGFLNYRPDFVVSSFVPCSILSAASDSSEHINDAIRREAHVFEFAAIKTLSLANVQDYLRKKLPNYVNITQEQ